MSLIEEGVAPQPGRVEGEVGVVELDLDDALADRHAFEDLGQGV